MEIARVIAENLYREADHHALINALDALIDYAQYHHAAEEKLTSLYAYPRAAGHDQRHQQLISQLTGYATVVLAGDLPDKAEFQRFFDSWLVQHINDEDRKCGGFLNAKGVY